MKRVICIDCINEVYWNKNVRIYQWSGRTCSECGEGGCSGLVVETSEYKEGEGINEGTT